MSPGSTHKMTLNNMKKGRSFKETNKSRKTSLAQVQLEGGIQDTPTEIQPLEVHQIFPIHLLVRQVGVVMEVEGVGSVWPIRLTTILQRKLLGHHCIQCTPMGGRTTQLMWTCDLSHDYHTC